MADLVDPIEKLLLEKRKLMYELQEFYPEVSRWKLTGINMAEVDLLKQGIAAYDEEIKKQINIKREAERVLINESAKPNNRIDFPDLPNLKWEDLTISFVSNDSVRIQAGDITMIAHYVDMGFRDKRKGDLPIQAWDFLKDLAENGGEISYSSNGFNSKNKIRVKVLRKILKAYFGIEADPFYAYKKCNAYKVKFGLKEKT